MAAVSEMFSWEGLCGCCDMSTAEGNNGFPTGNKARLFIVSEKTGRVEEFSLDSYDYDGEELESSTYLPVNEKLRKQGVVITLFND